MLGTAAIVLALAAAVYEAIAHFTRERVPYITRVVNTRVPWAIRAGGVLGAFVWALDHFQVVNI